MRLSSSAAGVAKTVLESDLPRRWAHVQSVAAKARQIAVARVVGKRDVLPSAAWLHDVGYAPGIKNTGFHALDGARWLRKQGIDERVVNLVAYHSCAIYEAEQRGLADELRTELVDEASEVTDALWYCDMTTGPDGQNMAVEERLAEIRSRYGPEHLVSRFWKEAEPVLIAAVRRTEERLAAAGVQPM